MLPALLVLPMLLAALLSRLELSAPRGRPDDEFTDAHWSGHYSLDEDAGRAWGHVDRMLRQLGAVIITNTERRTPTGLVGWSSWVPSRDAELRRKYGRDANGAECPIHADDSVWEVVARGAIQVTKLAVRRRGGDERPGVWLTWEFVRHQALGWTYLRMVKHNVSGVQRGKKWRGGRLGTWLGGLRSTSQRVRVWVAAARGTRQARLALVAKYHPDEQSLTLDGNADSRVVRWFKVLEAAYAGPGFRLLRLARGTKGRRGIDLWVTTLRIRGRLTVLKAIHGLDHGGILGRFRPRWRTLRRARRRGRVHASKMPATFGPANPPPAA